VTLDLQNLFVNKKIYLENMNMDKEKIKQVLSRYAGQNLWSEQVQTQIADDISYLSENNEIPLPPSFNEPTGVNPGEVTTTVEEPEVVEEVKSDEKTDDKFFSDSEEESKPKKFKGISKRKPLKRRNKSVSRSQK
tara:strand:+ start:752 stop:1156 length:405 start_codon:yes stop_codon:yes gene_type:complete